MAEQFERREIAQLDPVVVDLARRIVSRVFRTGARPLRRPFLAPVPDHVERRPKEGMRELRIIEEGKLRTP
jgi:hypothetical protein